MRIARCDRVEHLDNLPFLIFLEHRVLKELFPSPFKAPQAPGSAQRIQASPACWRGWARTDKRSLPADRAVTIHTVNLDGSARFGINVAVAVIVLGEMAIHTVHSFFKMDVGQMHGLCKALWIIEGDGLALRIEPVPFAVVVVNGSKDPAVPVEVGKLRRFEVGVELGIAELFQKFFVAPEAACRCTFRIVQKELVALLLARIVLLLRIHLVGVELVVPPRVPEIRGHHVCAGMDMTDHALARRNRACEDMANRMPGFVFRNRGIG